MRNLFALFLAFLLVSNSYAQQPSTGSVAPTSASATKAVLEDATPVKLRLSRNVSSASATTGETVDFEVLEEVKVGDVLVVPKGGVAWGTVTEAQSKRRLGRGGKLDMTIDSVRLVDGEKAALRAVKEAKGGGHTGAMTGAIVATSLIVWPAAPFFLFMHGKDITIPKGTEITAYVNGDFPLDLVKFTPPPASNAVSQTATATPAPATLSPTVLEISSVPPGAEIELDGSFVGNTPSSFTVTPGDHDISVSKSGYAPWKRRLKTSAGTVKISPELQPVDSGGNK